MKETTKRLQILCVTCNFKAFGEKICTISTIKGRLWTIRRGRFALRAGTCYNLTSFLLHYEAIASNKARPSVTIKKKRYVKLSKHNGLTAIFYNTDLSPLKIYAIITSRDTRHTKNQRFLVFRRTLKYPFGLHPAAQGHSPAFSRAIVLSSSDSIGEQGQQRF